MLEKKIRRYKLIDKHRELIRKGEYEQARLILALLRRGRIKLGLGDDCWAVEIFCENIGCPIYYSSNGYSITVHV